MLNRASAVYHRAERGVKAVGAALSPVLFASLIVACSGGSSEGISTPLPTPEATLQANEEAPAEAPALIPETTVAGYTHVRSDGNRLVAGSGGLPDATPIRVRLPGRPVWLVAVPSGDGSAWAVVMDDGAVVGFRVAPDGVESASVTPARLSPGKPPLLLENDGALRMITAVDPDAAPLSHPVLLPAKGGIGFLDTGGDIRFKGGIASGRIALGAVTDSRIITRDGSRLLVLSDATDRYPHGALGDDVEAATITIIAARPDPVIEGVIELPGQSVIEGQAPIWTDINGDGDLEILVTLSDARAGARLVAYSENGTPVAQSAAIGTGFRWRHQIAVGPFGPNGETEIVSVRTPHIGGIVEFFRWEGAELVLVAELPGYSSHMNGSRNLDMAIAGDFDGDGRAELLVPDSSFTRLAAVRRTATGAEEAWSVDPGGRLSTNLAAVENADGTVTVGAGIEDGALIIWAP